MSNDEPVYLLSLDGGGIRGISELVILHEIMKRFQKVAGFPELPKPCDHFHLIGGTSTGGLIAIMLGRMRMTTEEAIDCYMNFAKDIFRNSNRRFNRTYREKTLENRIKEVVAQRKLKTTAMIDEGRDKGLAFVCSVPEDNKKEPYLFRTYRGDTNHAHNVEIWEAARATTAAPTFFKPMLIKVEAAYDHYVDGALSVNNPAKLVLKEAETHFGTGRKLGFLLSLGTGLKSNDQAVNVDADAERVIQRSVQDAKPRTNSGALFSLGTIRVLKHAKEGVTDPEPTHHELTERFSGTPNSYFRFNLDRGASDIKLNQYKKMSTLRAATEEYLAKDETSVDIDQVVELLHTRGGARMPLASAFRARSDESDKHAVDLMVNNRTDVVSVRFTGREDILARMKQYFFDNAANPGTSRKLLRIWGMGGIGKTQIAVRFRDLHESNFDSVFWVNAATVGSIYESFRQMTETLFGGQTSRPEIKRVHEWMKQNKNWLLIFDNNDEVDISKWVPPGENGNILFTSRRGDIQPILDDSQTLAIDAMSEKSAFELLLKAASRVESEIGGTEMFYLKEVAKELGYLPLALDQAASYVHLTGCSFCDFFFEFTEKRRAFLEDASLASGAFEHNPAVYGTFELSYDALEKKSQEDSRKGRAAMNALRILNIFCFYNNDNLTDDIIKRAATNKRLDKDLLGNMEIPAPIPLPLLDLQDDGSWDPSNFSDGISLLRSYSLIKRSAANDEWHSMHILVHTWARDRMGIHTYSFFRQAARSIIFDSLPAQPKLDDERHLTRVYPHVKAIMLHGCTEMYFLKVTSQEAKFVRLLSNIGMLGDALWASDMVLQSRRENLETDSYLIVEALWEVGRINKICCKFEAALQALLEAGDLMKTCDYPVWAIRNFSKLAVDIAEVRIQQGQYGSAEGILNVAIEREIEKPWDRLVFIRILGAMATTMLLAGAYDKALRLEARLLGIVSDDARYGPGHRLTMSTTSNIAAVYSAQGKHEEAHLLWQNVLDANERFRGKEHPNTLQSKTNVAIGCMKLGRLDEAETMLREVLEASDRVLWRMHTDTLTTIECLAGVLYQKGEVEEALTLQEECLQGRLEVLEKDHQITRKTVKDLEIMVAGRPMGAMEQVQVQWQEQVSEQTGDSNSAVQGMNDRYLH